MAPGSYVSSLGFHPHSAFFSPANFYRNQVVCLPQTMSLTVSPRTLVGSLCFLEVGSQFSGVMFPLSISEKQTRIRNRSLRLTDLCVLGKGLSREALGRHQGSGWSAAPCGPVWPG